MPKWQRPAISAARNGNWVYTSKDKEGKTAVAYGKFTTIGKKTEARAVEGSPQHNKFQSTPPEPLEGEPSKAAKSFDKTIPGRIECTAR